MKPDDKPKKKKETFEDPKLFVVIGEESFPRSGLETAFMDYSNVNTESTEMNVKTTESTTVSSGTVVSSDTTVTRRLSSRCLCYFVTQTICTCNKMRPTCSCVGYVNSSRTVTGGGCSCAPVH